MGQEYVQLLCPECGVPGASDPESSRWQCSKCGNAFFLRRCSACSHAGYVDGLQGFHMPWACMWCGRFTRGFSQNRDPATATATEVAAEVARYGLPRVLAEAGDQESTVPVPIRVISLDPGDRDSTDRGPTSPAGIARPGAAPSPPSPANAASRSGRQSAWRAAVLIALAGTCAVAALTARIDSGGLELLPS